jgi:hypothetical protein
MKNVAFYGLGRNYGEEKEEEGKRSGGKYIRRKKKFDRKDRF